MNPTEQKIRECAEEITETLYGKGYAATTETVSILITRHFGQPEQPDKSLEEIIKKQIILLSVSRSPTPLADAIRQACNAYAATKGAKK